MSRRRPDYIDDAERLYWDVMSLVWTHYRMTEAGFDRMVERIADECERDGNGERADWLRALVAGEDVEG